MEQISFREKLRRRQEKIKSVLCVGLDPLLEKMPKHLRTPGPAGAHDATDTAMWMMSVIDATAPFTCMYKLQRAHWEAIPGGVVAMQMVITYIETRYSDIVVFTDCKRGDIGRTQSQYRVAQFDIDGTEGMNFSPYMGKDCMEFLVDDNNKLRAIVGLCYTSNSSAREVQDVVLANGQKYWEFMAETILRWSEELGITENAGLVMAAAYEYPKKSGIVYSEHLARIRELVGNKLWLLIPGVGTQGGFIKETVNTAFTGWGSIAINASSSVIFAGDGENFLEKVAEEARLLYVAVADAMMIEVFDRVPESLIILGDPLATLKNCGGYYSAVRNNKVVGPLVAYNGTYVTDGGPNLVANYVGLEYYDFAYAEAVPAVRKHFAKLIKNKIMAKCKSNEPNLFIGAAYGGILLASELSDLFSGSNSVFTTKKVTEVKTEKSKEKSHPEITRHVLRAGSKAVIVEDVSNNKSEIDKIIALAAKQNCKVVALVCAFNRSSETEYKGLPIISACHIPTDQWRQDSEFVVNLIQTNGIEWSPKNNFSALKLLVKDKEREI